MTESSTLIVVTTLSSVLTAFLAPIIAFFVKKQADTLQKVKDDAERTRLTVEQMHTALVKSVGELMYAKGIKDESERRNKPI